LCKECMDTLNEAWRPRLAYPYRGMTRKNIKNTLGGIWGDYGPKPNVKMKGLSGSPHRKTPLNYRSHEVYMTRERALEEGYKD
jgi:hypothetical protein